MDISILRLARRYKNGARRWTCPGFGVGAQILPTGKGHWPDAMSVSWPCADPNHPGGRILRAARLDWHKSIIKRGVRDLLAACHKA